MSALLLQALLIRLNSLNTTVPSPYLYPSRWFFSLCCERFEIYFGCDGNNTAPCGWYYTLQSTKERPKSPLNKLTSKIQLGRDQKRGKYPEFRGMKHIWISDEPHTIILNRVIKGCCAYFCLLLIDTSYVQILFISCFNF